MRPDHVLFCVVLKDSRASSRQTAQMGGVGHGNGEEEWRH